MQVGSYFFLEDFDQFRAHVLKHIADAKNDHPPLPDQCASRGRSSIWGVARHDKGIVVWFTAVKCARVLPGFLLPMLDLDFERAL